MLSESATKADVTAAIDHLRATDLTEIRADIIEIRADIIEIRADITEIKATMATKEDLKLYATKVDLENFGNALRAEVLAEIRHLFKVQLDQLYGIIKIHVEGTDASISKLENKITTEVTEVRSELEAHRTDSEVHRSARRRPARGRRRPPGGARRPSRTRR